LENDNSPSEGFEVEGIKKLLKVALDLEQDMQPKSPPQKLLDICVSALGASVSLKDELIAAFFQVNSNGDGQTDLTLLAGRNFPDEDTQILLPVEGSFISQVVKANQPRLLLNGLDDAVIRQIDSLSKCRAYYCVPVGENERSEALLLFAHPHVDFFTAECRQVLAFIGSQAQTILKDYLTRQKMISNRKSQFEIQTRSRKMFARQLHDGPTQAIAALAMRMNIIRRLLQNPSAELVDELDKVEELARQTTKEMRHLLFALHPYVLETQGLEAALNDLAEKMLAAFNQKVILKVEPGITKDFTLDEQFLIFDIVVEAVVNSRKHAQANNIWVRLKNDDDSSAQLEIEDDGLGFELTEEQAYLQQGVKFGLLNMRESVNLINGEFTIKTSLGEGTIIQVRLPLGSQIPIG
jgi:signal transduction histidine kinase